MLDCYILWYILCSILTMLDSMLHPDLDGYFLCYVMLDSIPHSMLDPMLDSQILY